MLEMVQKGRSSEKRGLRRGGYILEHFSFGQMSVKVGRVDGGLDFIEDDQFLCHVQTLRLREILGAKSQERNQHAALISQMLIEGEAAQGGSDHLTNLPFIPWI